MDASSKVCFKCSVEKPLTEFYRHSAMADGHLGKCKECTRKDVQANRYTKIDYYKEYDRSRNDSEERLEARRRYRRTEAGKAIMRAANRRYIERYPEKQKARRAVSNAVRDGKLVRQPCEVCGTTVGVEAHHDDYSKPLDVKWLCDRHHKDRHKELRRLLREAESN